MFTSVAPSDQPDPYLAAAIRRLRIEKGLTQEEVAGGAELTLMSYGEIDRGRSNPAWTTVRRIAESLDVSLAELAQAVEDAEG